MQNSIFIEKDDLVKLTGTKIRKLQVEHLVKSNIPFQQDRNGYPQVLLESIKSSATESAKISSRKPRVNPKPLNIVEEKTHG